MSLYRYFKPVSSSSSSSSLPSSSDGPRAGLPSPDGPLSKLIPASTIQAANDSVEKVIGNGASGESDKSKRGAYCHYTDKDRATIGNYAVQHGTASAIKHFAPKYPALKWSTVNDWKKEIVRTTKLHMLENNGEVISIDELEKKKRGRPATLSEELSKDLRLYIRSIREGGGLSILQL